MKYTTLVSSSVLAAHLDGSWAIVDCRDDLQDEKWGRQQYHIGHVPGAVYASLAHDLSAAPTGSNGRHPLPSLDAMVDTFGRLGIDRDTQVVVYDQDTGLFASRLWWMLRYAGHDHVAVLDGGWATWVREHRPIASGSESRTPTTFVAAPRPEWRVDAATVQHTLPDGQTLLVDARGPERFEGRSEPLDRVAGHIPGAANHFYKWNLDENGTMLPPERLKETFRSVLGTTTPAQTIMYCGSGVSACHNLLAMEHAGLGGARLYPGSWSEWSSDPTRPVETGPQRER